MARATCALREGGGSDVSAWREDRRLYTVAAQGAGSVSDFPFFDRGTWEQSVAMGQP